MNINKQFQYLDMTKSERIIVVRYSCTGKLTFFSKYLMIELTEAAEIISKLSDVNAVVLCADGPFCSGADLKDKD